MQLIYSRLHDVPAIDGHEKNREPLVKTIVKNIKKTQDRRQQNRINLTTSILTQSVGDIFNFKTGQAGQCWWINSFY
jgi:hypothetical protein